MTKALFNPQFNLGYVVSTFDGMGTYGSYDPSIKVHHSLCNGGGGCNADTIHLWMINDHTFLMVDAQGHVVWVRL